MNAWDEKRAAATRMEEGFGQEADYLSAIESMRRLADVIEYADQFVQGDPDNMTPGGSVARVILTIAREGL